MSFIIVMAYVFVIQPNFFRDQYLRLKLKYGQKSCRTKGFNIFIPK